MNNRLELENAIFARACLLGTPIYARNGGLFSRHKDPLLQQLLAVYNSCFQAENMKQFCTEQEPLETWRIYRARREHRPGLSAIYSPAALNFELLLTGDL